MGSLSSAPKVPQQQVIYVPAPTATPQSQTSTPAQDSADLATQSRKKSLLSRNRGRFGTIATSFQGFLSNKVSGARKTLLGE